MDSPGERIFLAPSSRMSPPLKIVPKRKKIEFFTQSLDICEYFLYLMYKHVLCLYITRVCVVHKHITNRKALTEFI